MVIDPSTPSLENPGLSDILEVFEKSIGFKLRVAMPGRIEAYDPETHLADVQPLVKVKRQGESQPTALPVIPRVSVIHFRSSAGAVYLPLAKGDLVTLLFSDRALDAWKAGSGQITQPGNTRTHDLIDCWAIPGGYPIGKPPRQYNSGALELWLKPGTKVSIGNGTDELVQLVTDAATAVKDAATELKATLAQLQGMLMTLVTPGVGTSGPPDPTSVAIYAASETAVDGVITSINSTISSLGKIKV